MTRSRSGTRSRPKHRRHPPAARRYRQTANCRCAMKVTFCVRGVLSPLLSNLYLNEVDKMLERAREVTRNGKYTNVEYARFADDLVVLINAYKRHDWLIG